MKILQRTKVLSANGNVLYEGTQGGPRKIRCTRCNQNYATAVKGQNGKTFMQCPCGAKYAFKSM